MNAKHSPLANCHLSLATLPCHLPLATPPCCHLPLATFLCLLLCAGCQQKMAVQPSYPPLGPSRLLGAGPGTLAQRGSTRPPSYRIERVRKAPVGYLFAVSSEGYGSMPSYAQQIPPRDRWAIVAYLRALQLSQHYPTEQLTREMRAQF